MIIRTMKDFIFPLFGIQIVATTLDDYPLWERLLEKWGIGFIGLALLYLLARWTSKREEDSKAETKLREEMNQAERVKLLQRNNELQAEIIETMNAHAKRLEALSKDSIKTVSDAGAAMRMLVRQFRRPCVIPFHTSDIEQLEELSKQQLTTPHEPNA